MCIRKKDGYYRGSSCKYKLIAHIEIKDSSFIYTPEGMYFSELTINNSTIYTWTIADIAKRDYAIKNKLNYIVVWNLTQINQLIKDIHNVRLIGFIDYNTK